MDGIFVPIVLFCVIGICVALGMYYRFRSRQELQLTVRNAIDSGQPFSPEVLAGLSRALFPPQSDLRKGIVLCAVGIAFIIFAFMIDEEDAIGPLLGLSAFPFTVGIAYLILSKIGKDQDQART